MGNLFWIPSFLFPGTRRSVCGLGTPERSQQSSLYRQPLPRFKNLGIQNQRLSMCVFKPPLASVFRDETPLNSLLLTGTSRRPRALEHHRSTSVKSARKLKQFSNSTNPFPLILQNKTLMVVLASVGARLPQEGVRVSGLSPHSEAPQMAEEATRCGHVRLFAQSFLFGAFFSLNSLVKQRQHPEKVVRL